jgi:uncharacterized phiE125 gp8 family phage protein
VAASTTLTTRAALKLYLGIEASDTAQDELLDALVAYASERIESHCRRAFASEALTEYLDGTGASKLVLSRRPVSALTSIHEDSDRAFAAATEIDSADLVLHPENGIVERMGAVFAPGARTLKVVYTAGYATVPDDVALACAKLAAAWYAHARGGADGVTRETLGDYAATYAHGALPADVEGALAAYRDVRTA